MSCEIKTLFKLNDLNRVQELFGLGKDDEWLDSVYFSISPSLEIIAFGHGTRLIMLNQVWNRDEQHNAFAICHVIELENPNDVITSIICLPIVAQHSHTQSSPEWSAVGVGLSSGLVLFYTDFGMKIFSQQWHNEAVESISAQSGKGLLEEIYFGYESCVCIVDGLNFFTVLHNIKQQNLRVVSHNKQETSGIHEFTVPCRKWGFDGKNLAINDLAVVGPQLLSSFDHLLNTTINGGFYAKYRSSPAQNSLVLAAGSRPYVGFHYAKEGFVQPVLADVARTVASKIKNALPSWMRGSQSVDLDLTPLPSPVKQMTCPFGLCDLQRTGMRVYLAPGNQLAAVTDSLGRVILVDCKRATAIRVFKGYRKAQCSFIEVIEKNSKQQQQQKQDRRRALFLVIYAPKRSCLEIWPLQRGAKTAAFYVSKHGQLIYNSYNLMGASSNTKIRYSSSNQHTCLFFDPSDQTIKEIQIPFYCAISDSNSKIAKDLHLIRRIKLNLKSEDLESPNEKKILNEISMLTSNLQTNEMRIICLEMLSKNSKTNPEILKSAILAIQTQLQIEDEDIEQDSDAECHRLESIEENPILDKPYEVENLPKNQRKHLTILCDNYLKLLDFYSYAVEMTNAEIVNSEEFQKSSNSNQISISADELDNIQKLLDLLCLERKFMPDTPKVHFRVDENEKQSNRFIIFLSSFNIQNDDLILLDDKKASLHKLVGSIIFKKFLENGKSSTKFVRQANESGILSEDLMRLLLFYWLEKPFLYRKSEQLVVDMQRFTETLENVCLLAGNKVEYDYNSISLWWQTVRELLLESSCALRGLLAAMMCRNQALKCCQKEKTSDDNTSEEDMNFEELSQEACQWSLLIGKLDDSAVLGAILNIVIQINEPVLPIIKYEKRNISLKSLLAGGKGIVTELVAKWIAGTGLDPRMLFEKSDSDENCNNATITTENSNVDLILSNIRLLRDHFPFSLQPGILLCHLSWDFMGYWSNNMSQLNYLSAGLKCLSSIEKSNWAVKHGICCMIWNAHLKMPLEATRKLIDKVGHLPREKFCLQDIGISDSLVSKFLELCIQFLEIFIECLDHDKMELQYEEILQEGEIPLVLLALQQSQANLELLNLHAELLIVLQFISQFNVKQVKPKNLFNELINQTFFCQINKSLGYELSKPDLILVNIRKKFLYKLISASMDLIREDYEKIYYVEHIEWYGRIEKLGRIWKINENELKRHQISELYVHGWDEFAEQLLLNFCEIGDLGFRLLDVAGNRLNSYINSDSSAWGHVATVSPSLTTFLDKLSTENTDITTNDDKPVDLDKLIKLTQQAFEFLSKSNQNQKEFKLAGLLFDACSTIKQYQ